LNPSTVTYKYCQNLLLSLSHSTQALSVMLSNPDHALLNSSLILPLTSEGSGSGAQAKSHEEGSDKHLPEPAIIVHSQHNIGDWRLEMHKLEFRIVAAGKNLFFSNDLT